MSAKLFEPVANAKSQMGARHQPSARAKAGRALPVEPLRIGCARVYGMASKGTEPQWGQGSVIEHILLAVIIQLTIRAILGSWSAGAAAAIAWFASREVTQAEYRWIEHFGAGHRANMPWWGGLDRRVWGYADPWIDWIAPTVAVIAIALIARRWRGTQR